MDNETKAFILSTVDSAISSLRSGLGNEPTIADFAKAAMQAYLSIPNKSEGLLAEGVDEKLYSNERDIKTSCEWFFTWGEAMMKEWNRIKNENNP